MDGLFIDPQLLATPLDKPFLFLRSDTAEVNLQRPPDDRLPIIEAMIHDDISSKFQGRFTGAIPGCPVAGQSRGLQGGL